MLFSSIIRRQKTDRQVSNPPSLHPSELVLSACSETNQDSPAEPVPSTSQTNQNSPAESVSSTSEVVKLTVKQTDATPSPRGSVSQTKKLIHEGSKY
jgi:hypothetical protein